MTELTYELVLLASLICAASTLGVFALYSHTIMPGLRSTDDGTFVRSFQAIDRRIINPIFMTQFFLPLVLLAVAAFYAFSNQLAETLYVVAALVSYLFAVVVTMAVNVPLNDGIKKVTNTTDAKTLQDARTAFNEAKWVLCNHIRTVLSLVAVGCIAVTFVIA